MHSIPKAPLRCVRDQRGVTLVEIMVVVIIMGLLSAMVIPRFTNYVSTLRAGGAANQLAADIAYTRMMAVREGRTTSLTLTDTTWAIVVENADGSVRRALRTVQVKSSYAGTTLAGGGGNGRVAFDSRGLLRPNSTASVTVTRQGRSQTLTISGIGRVIREKAQ